jgi:hypothetical protein
MIDSTVLLFWIIFAIIGGAIGMTKNRAAAGILLGVFLGPLGIIIVLILEKREGEVAASSGTAVSTSKTFDPSTLTKKCPDCAETIKLEAHVCRFCQKRYSDEEVVSQIATSENEFLSSKAKEKDLTVDPVITGLVLDLKNCYSKYSNEKLQKIKRQGTGSALIAVDLILAERGID